MWFRLLKGGSISIEGFGQDELICFIRDSNNAIPTISHENWQIWCKVMTSPWTHINTVTVKSTSCEIKNRTSRTHLPTACTKEDSTSTFHVSSVQRHLVAKVTTSTAPVSLKHCPKRGTNGAAIDSTRESVWSSRFLFKEEENKLRQKRTAAIAAGSEPASVFGPLASLP